MDATRVTVLSLFLALLMGSPSSGEETSTAEHQALVALLKLRVIKSVEFEAFSRVKRIAIAGNRFRDKHLIHLMPFKGVESLQLRETRITNDGLKQVARLQSLRFLDLDKNSKITSQGIAHLKRLKGLTTLKLADKLFLGAEFDHSILKTIKELPNLTSLTIDARNMGNDAVPDLQSMKQLKELDIQSTSITKDGVRQLQKALPQCTIKGPTRNTKP